jgi:phage N-6-adenine-methyltransferase
VTLPAVTGQLDPSEARTLTDEVKRDVVALREKLLRLYEGGAHLALGYASWAEYWQAEFETAWQHGYRQLDAARVDRLIHPWANDALPERQARELVPLLDQPAALVDVVLELRAEHGDRLTADKVRSAVEGRLRLEQQIGMVTASDTFEWYTPAVYVDAARQVLGGIDLDPASSAEANATVKAASYYDAETDGLARSWRGRVWLNPPYSGLAGRFVGKLLDEYAAGRVTAAVLLLNGYRFDAAWFQPLWDGVLCFTDHRIKFTSPLRDSSPNGTTASVFVYVGPDRARFARAFSEFGHVVEKFAA